MLARAVKKLGYRTAVLDPNRRAPAMQIADVPLVAEYDDLRAAAKLADVADVVTYEFENIKLDAVARAAETVNVFPSVNVLKIAQNRLLEKQAVQAAGADVADYRAVSTFDDLRLAVAELGAGILKTATMGYDGKGQWRINSPADIAPAMVSGEMVYEKLVNFKMECSVIVARAHNGDMRTFPVAENAHVNGILDTSIAPARVKPRTLQKMRRVARKIADHLDLCGILAVEMFVTAYDRVLINELAPRPHNSGHYTLEACYVSQFKQLARILVGLPLGNTALKRPAAMVNLMGELWLDAKKSKPPARPQVSRWQKSPASRAKRYIYGKNPPKTGRKMGHITALADTTDQALQHARTARTNLTK